MDNLKLHGKTEKGLDSLTQTVRIFRSDTCIEFGIESAINETYPKERYQT